MRLSAVGLIGLLFDMMLLLDEARHVLSHYQAERSQVLDLLHDYLLHHHNHNRRHHHSQKVIIPHPAEDGLSTAYLFQGSNRSVEATSNMLQTVKSLFETTKSFTIVTTIRQERKNVGSILSIGNEKESFLELESSGWRQELRFNYAHRTRTRTETIPCDVTDDRWHKVAISVVGATHLEVFVDCQLIFQRNIPEMDLDLKSSDESPLHLWIGQRNTRHVYFKGAMEYLKIVTSGTGYLEQCPHANVACPSCSQFQQLQLSFQQLQSTVFELTKQVEHANRRILELEKCECRKQCEVDGKTYRDGEVIPSDEQCSLCNCKNGEVICEQRRCPDVNCKNPVIPKNECCPVCLKHCVVRPKSGKVERIEHGEEMKLNSCDRYFCNNGNLTFKRQQRKSCPRLSCPKQMQVKVENECCKICRGTDWCLKNSHQCPDHSTCISLETNFTCSCDRGFAHVGKLCQDVDECKSVGGKNGHHCRNHSRCVNTVGSYHCECLPGYTKDDVDDEFSCKEIDFCEHTERNVCSLNAQCIRTPGSFICECNEGYEGDGFECKPICPEPCQNGGTCTAIGKCSCRHGYKGRNCDTDVDECSDGISSCHPNSVCVNIPGSYYCRCKDGYYSSGRLDNERGALCRDLDECQGWGGGQHCPDSGTCHNSDGGYECLCSGNSSCSPGCSVDGKVYRDGETWKPKKDGCLECQCRNGRVSCDNRLVDCRDGDDDGVCCKSRHTCRHQDSVTNYTTGQRWTYKCSTCQCHEGEMDCWPMECPKLTCSEVIYSEGECCPRCSHSDPCSGDALSETTSTSKASSCQFRGQTVQHQQNLLLDSSNCSLCQCVNGSICCSYNQTCAGGVSGGSFSLHQRSRFVQETTRNSRPRARTRHEERQAEDNG